MPCRVSCKDGKGHKLISDALDHYATLGTTPEMTRDEIKSLWRKAAKAAHPDTNPGNPHAEARFKSLAIAWSVLGHAERRAAYDARRKPPAQPRARNGGGSAATSRTASASASPSNAPPEAVRRNSGQDGTITASLRDAYQGECQARVEVRTALRCPSCHDKAEPWLYGPRCERCNGHGTVACMTGFHATLPAGCKEGTAFLVQLMSVGSVSVRLFYKNQRPYELDGHDLLLTRAVSRHRLAKGTTVTVSLPDARRIKVSVPAGTAYGAMLHLRGVGMPRKDGSKGDAIVTVVQPVATK